mmetsp:Transcript_24010/g.54622  ORF Transcript_24010/g.54622 Transcript_24010/m.54622 type:complete len:232 (+) Transcript_24010:163-858(+)
MPQDAWYRPLCPYRLGSTIDARRAVDAQYPHAHHEGHFGENTHRPRRHVEGRGQGVVVAGGAGDQAQQRRYRHEGPFLGTEGIPDVQLLPEGEAVHLPLTEEIGAALDPVHQTDGHQAVQDVDRRPAQRGLDVQERIGDEEEVGQEDQYGVHGGEGEAGLDERTDGRGDRRPTALAQCSPSRGTAAGVVVSEPVRVAVVFEVEGVGTGSDGGNRGRAVTVAVGGGGKWGGI